jgi:hypothetical protein
MPVPDDGIFGGTSTRTISSTSSASSPSSHARRSRHQGRAYCRRLKHSHAQSTIMRPVSADSMETRTISSTSSASSPSSHALSTGVATDMEGPLNGNVVIRDGHTVVG